MNDQKQSQQPTETKTPLCKEKSKKVSCQSTSIDVILWLLKIVLISVQVCLLWSWCYITLSCLAPNVAVKLLIYTINRS